MEDRTRTPRDEELDIQQRISKFGAAHVVREPGQQAVLRLKRRGLVDYGVVDGVWVVTAGSARLGGAGSGGGGMVA
jgi:hypothetical protein